jgi:hypothetical protein
MAAALGIVVAVTLPVLVLVGLLAAVDRLQRRRLRVIARQVAVTDAIHREFGAVVAPVVSKRWWGPWTVLMALPPDRWAMAGALAAIVHRVMSAGDRRDGRVHVVLTPRKELARRIA